MSLEKRISKLEKKNAALEYRLKEQQKVIEKLEPWTEKIEEMLEELIKNPFGAK